MQELTIFIAHHPLLFGLAVFAILLLILIEIVRQKGRTFNINTLRATQLMNHQNAVVIDIRAKDTYRKGHIIDAISLPAKELAETSKKLEKYKSKPIIIVCGAGIESQKIATKLIKDGYNAHSLSGGMRVWCDENLPVVKN